MVDMPDSEKVHASAVSFLIDGHKEEAARVLLSCELEISEHFVWLAPDEGYNDGTFDIELNALKDIYEIIKDLQHPTTKAIQEALTATLNGQPYQLTTDMLLPEVAPDWREKLLKATQVQKVDNQGNNAPYEWNDLRFRSKSEIKIAQALDKTGVLFFPNCMARLGSISGRENREADFLICDEGKWGILEVDGEIFHSTAAKDHGRDRLFRSYGVRVIERFTADQCYNNPDAVVRQFLTILKKNA